MGEVSSYQNRNGVWVTYNNPEGNIASVMVLHEDVVPAARECARQKHGNVLFWPFGMTFQSAVHWWEAQEESPEDAEEEKTRVHFLVSGNVAVCGSPTGPCTAYPGRVTCERCLKIYHNGARVYDRQTESPSAQA